MGASRDGQECPSYQLSPVAMRIGPHRQPHVRDRKVQVIIGARSRS